MSNMLQKIKLLKKCELCHKYIATKRASAFADKKIWICKKCCKIVKF